MIAKIGLITGVFLFGAIVGYWGYHVVKYTYRPEDV